MSLLKEKLNWKVEEQEKLEQLLAKLRKINETEINKWELELPNQINEMKNKWGLTDFNIYQSGRLGLIMSSYSSRYQCDVVLKVIPKCLQVFDVELNAYKNLSDKYMCPLLDIDNDNSTLLLKKLQPGIKFNFEEEKENLRPFFDNVYDNTFIDTSNNEAFYYINQYKKNLNILKDNNMVDSKRKIWNEEAIKLYDECYKNEMPYLIHSDLHAGNVLKDNNNYYAIDPLGYIAPKNFIFTRTIMIELFYANEYEIYLNELLDYFSKYQDKKDLLQTLFIDANFLLSALLIQFKGLEFRKIDNIIEIIINYIKKYEERSELVLCKK